jgi:hypothetical protein
LVLGGLLLAFVRELVTNPNGNELAPPGPAQAPPIFNDLFAEPVATSVPSNALDVVESVTVLAPELTAVMRATRY